MRSICNLIIGMHRSGTSLLASLVQGLGVDVGTDLHPADQHNAAGYFEDRVCMEIQERMLLQLGCPWHGAAGMSPLPEEWWRRPEIRPLVEELESWLDRRLLTAGAQWAVKDPRTTRFIPLWRELLEQRGVSLRFLLALRNPAEVVASEIARDGVPAARIFETWLRYNADALLDAGAYLAGVYAYDRWFTAGLEQLRELSAALGIEADDDSLRALLSARTSANLYHARDPRLVPPAWARRASDLLGELVGKDASLSHRQRVATELEYLAAIAAVPDAPQHDGALSAVVAKARDAEAAWVLAARESRLGRRAIVAFVDAPPEKPATLPAGIAAVAIHSTGPRLEGSQHVRASYRVWQWLQQRRFDRVDLMGGEGLAANFLDARNHGRTDSDLPVHVHYTRSPDWLDDDGVVRYRGVAEVEAYCLEARVISDPGVSLEGDLALLARLRQLAPTRVLPRAAAVPPTDWPLVTVCVTHYDRPALLQDCIASVRALTYPSLECVLVDDGSNSATAAAVLAELESEFDARGWRLIRQENRYLGAARNAAARVARGKYLFFLDDDNLLQADGLEQVVGVAERMDAAIVTSVMAKFSGPAGTRPARPESLWVFPGASALLGIFENCFGDANALVRRDAWQALEGFTERRGLGLEDWEFYARATLGGYRLEHCLRPVSWYRVDDAGMARSGDWWRDYRRALGPYRNAQVPELEALPALSGMLQRRIAEHELNDQAHVLALAELREERAGLAESVASGEAERVALAEQLASSDAGRAELAERLASSDAARAELVERLASSDAARSNLAEEVSALRNTLRSTTNRLHEATLELDSLYRSSSWQLTAPLRALKTRIAPRASRRAAELTVASPPQPPAPVETPPSEGRLTLEALRAEPLVLADFSSPPAARRRWTPEHPDLETSPEPIIQSVSVVIPTKNAGGEFGGLLRRLTAQRGVGPIQIVVVDSGSTDGTVEVAAAFGAHVIQIEPGEFSHSYARNLGADAAQSENLLFMVQDAFPIGSFWLHGMLRYLNSHAANGLAAVSCAEFSRADSDPMYDCMIETHYEFLGCLENDRLGRLCGTEHESLRRNGQLSDVACLISKDEFMGLRYRGDYGEDLDLGIRLIKSGRTVAMMASVKVLHSHNRPARYYLKRSYVDVAFLRTMFADFPIPPTLPLAGMVAGALSMGGLLTLRLDDWSQGMLGRPIDSVLKALIDEIRTCPIGDYVDKKLELDDEAVCEFVEALRVRFNVTADTLRRPADADAARRFVDLFHGRVNHFAAFACRVYGIADAPLAEAARRAILKAYAASVGAALGFAYQELAGTDSEEHGQVAEIAEPLKAGV